MTAPLTIREIIDEADWQAVRAIREAVFVQEQACPPDEEWDAHDAADARGRTVHHLLATLGAEPVACARWRPVGDVAKLERFAVLVPFRGRGIAREMVSVALAEARAAGFTRFALHAQSHLAGFYASFGFAPHGDLFGEAGIEHVKMTLDD